VSETGTLGIRIRTSSRYVVPRILVSVPVVIHGKSFTVRCKIVKDNDIVKNFKVESQDVKSVSGSLDISFKDALELISSEVKQKIHLK
jgi:pyridinium-3,5-bisthiocarboxylic acid mononucleotide nickel chelatase